MFKFAVCALSALALGACAGRAPQLTPLVLTSDPHLSCGAIQAEAKLNNARISDLAAEQNWKLGQNAVAGIVGFMAWPAWLGLDLQNAAGHEAKALSQRNDYLATLASTRCNMQQTASSGAMTTPSLVPTFASTAEIGAGFSSTVVSR